MNKLGVTFRELEEAAQRSSMRTYYKMANYGVHADSKGIFCHLGVLGDQSLILAGTSDAGFADPGQNAAITLVQITRTSVRRADREFGCHGEDADTAGTLREEAIEEFVRARRKLDRDHAKLRAEEHGAE